jgi:biofilm PGA synthesis N-glycosyltransferase PgaC
MFLLYLCHIIPAVPLQPYIPPGWAGSVLALVCLIQSMVSLFIDSHYEERSLVRYFFWIIWYPFFYWLISAFAVLAGFDKVFISREKTKGTWISPDRGLQPLKS